MAKMKRKRAKKLGDMNYQRIYDEIIAKAILRTTVNGYYESHHIIPKCMNGFDEPNNIARLTGREHYLVHHLLTKIYPSNEKLLYAFKMMCCCGSSKQHRAIPKLTSKQYALLRNEFSKSVSKMMKGNKFWFGKTHTEDTKNTIKEKLKNRNFSEATRTKMQKPRAKNCSLLRTMNKSKGDKCYIDGIEFSCVSKAVMYASEKYGMSDSQVMDAFADFKKPNFVKIMRKAPNSKHLMIDNIEFESLRYALFYVREKYNIGMPKLKERLNSNEWEAWKFL